MTDSLPRIAIVGAGGFLGSRLIEAWYLGGHIRPVAIVRRPPSMARFARFPIEWKIADANNSTALANAISGCDGVVHATIASPLEIIASARSFGEALKSTGVARAVYLSTALVHGPAPDKDFDESTPFDQRQDSDYGLAKIQAEKTLSEVALPGLVKLRPGIVYGPRSRWISDTASAAQKGTLAWINGGNAICPAIYVDNLIHAIECALTAPLAAVSSDRAYLVRDTEEVRWNQFYRTIVDYCMGPDLEIPEGRVSARPSRLSRRLENLRVHPRSQAALAHVPNSWKQAVKGAIQGFKGTQVPAGTEGALRGISKPSPSLSIEMADLQRNQAVMIDRRAHQNLGYAPPVSFTEGMVRSLEWLKFTGMIR
ncbi:MAG: hypothetical protein SynsKO_13000 [Synoicihabitans sp.]